LSSGQPKKRETPSQITDGRAGGSQIAPTVFQSDEFLSKRYDLIRRIGKGGMSAVFLATDRQLDRQVAVKVMKPFSGDEAEAATSRFITEARICARLNHRNIVHIYDFAATESGLRMIMEYVEGATLYQRVKRDGPMSEMEVGAIACEILDALETTHGQNVVHRDIKPGNVMLDDQGRVKVLDFGIAFTGGVDADASSGAIVGTRKFMAPEQSRAEPATVRSDLFSLGATMAFMLLGELPAVLNPGDLPAQLRPVLVRAMALEPGDRFASAAEMREAIEDTFREKPAGRPAPAAAKRRSPMLVLVPAGLLIGLLISGLMLLPDYLRNRSAGNQPPPGHLEADQETPSLIIEDAGVDDQPIEVFIEDEETDEMPQLPGMDVSGQGDEAGDAGLPTPNPGTTSVEIQQPPDPPPGQDSPTVAPDPPAGGGNGGATATTEAATLAPPAIKHYPPKEVTDGASASFEVWVYGDALYEVKMHFRPAGSSSWRTLDLRDRGGSRYTGSMRIGSSLADGVEYYLTVKELDLPGRTFNKRSADKPYSISAQ